LRFLGQPPPLTITGVAPWALKSPPDDVKNRIDQPRTSKHSDSFTHCDVDLASYTPSLTEVNVKRGIDVILDYISDCYPDAIATANDNPGATDWAIAQIAPRPKLLPNLKFHDLVFGDELGYGAFSSVKYARQIVKEKSRDFWPEYAVKIVSASKMQEYHYEENIEREIGIMQLLLHPGISRLISFFRLQLLRLLLAFISIINCN
jgi:hypothetical protein